MSRWQVAVLAVLAASITLGVTGCGYHEMGAATHIPANVQTLAVPMFVSKVQGYNTETVFTQAVVRELNTRTNYRVLVGMNASDAIKDADAVLRGTILQETVSPLTYDSSSGQTSSYLVMVTASVQLVAHDGKVLYSNDAFVWREQYQSTEALRQFVQEDGFAVRRMGRDFAQALVSEMLEGF
ncbi:MAG: LPS assembly lipoprotein LptE [Acidobacteriaceae bacterium]